MLILLLQIIVNGGEENSENPVPYVGLLSLSSNLFVSTR